MFQPWRIKLREAEDALRGGRLDEARRLLSEGNMSEFRPAKQLQQRLAEAMARRAEQRVAAGQTVDGLRDLETAALLGGENPAIAEVRQQLVDRASTEARNLLEVGEPAAAVAALAELERQGPTSHEVLRLRDAAERIRNAQNLCRAGKFIKAEEDLSAAAALRPDLKVVPSLRSACVSKAAEGRRLGEQLHEALLQENWTAALATADALLDIAPEHAQARDARRRAWAQVGLRCSDRSAAPAVNGHQAAAAVMSPSIAEPEIKRRGDRRRFMLWVDGVGGFLVCLGDETLIGQPVPDSEVDVPILGDISRKHAVVRRDGESYVLRALRPVKLNGRPVENVALLRDGAALEMGGGVKLGFHCPHPLSRTARLEFTSHHRTQPSTDGVVLMADTCILGPSSSSHIVCPGWTEEVVLYQQQGELYCRSKAALQIDGKDAGHSGRLAPRSTVAGEDFSMSLEPFH